MFNKEICKNVEKVVEMSNFWLLPETEKVSFRHKIHKSYNCFYEKCLIDEEIDLISRKRTYWIEIHKKDGRILSKTVLSLEKLYDFLNWHENFGEN